jgi:hypothetical protein
MGQGEGPESCFNRTQAPHLGSRLGADQSRSEGAMGEGESEAVNTASGCDCGNNGALVEVLQNSH